MIDDTHVRCHQHSAGAVGGNQAIGLTKGGETLQDTPGRGFIRGGSTDMFHDDVG
jgi:hypothetical protein